MQTNVALELIDRDELQRLQDEFCRATGICAYCLDCMGQQITSISGSEEQREKVKTSSTLAQLKNAIERVEEGSLEDQAIEELEQDGDYIALRRTEGTSRPSLMCWIC